MINFVNIGVLIKAYGEVPVVMLTSSQFSSKLALLLNIKQTVIFVAKTDIECHLFMRNNFHLLLGDLQSLIDGGTTGGGRERAAWCSPTRPWRHR